MIEANTHLSTHPPQYSYRPDIDGLRGIAVLAVVFFHAKVPFSSAGFIGVDVFFVISGYLITCIIRKEIANNTFSLLNFWERRIRRIVPAQFFVIVLCSIGSWVYLLPGEFKNFFQSVLTQAFFASNILFYYEANYFSTAAELKPLQHMWSLSVEEQFYLLFPLLLLFLKRYTITFVVILAFGSLFLSEIYTSRNPSAAFYLLPFRNVGICY